MYGPPPDPRQISLDLSLVEAPLPYLGCAVVAAMLLGFALWRRPPVGLRAGALILGQVVLLTAPLLFVLPDAVFGAFPTIDKEGSLLFYLDGVHRRVMAAPLDAAADPAARLIGVHVGHLWVTELFELVLAPLPAFSAQGLLYPAFGWGAAALLLHTLCGDARVALLLGMPFGMGLHVFRDLNWYTIEKAAVGWLALFAWALLRAWRDGGRWPWVAAAVYGLMAWMNLYLALVGAALGALALVWTAAGAVRSRGARAGFRGLALACLGCALVGLPLAGWQHMVMAGGAQLATPEQFLTQRAALDGVSLWPPAWNRLELWRALDPVSVVLACLGLVATLRTDRRVGFALVAGSVLAALSLGPDPVPGSGLSNPVYMAAWHGIPGFWRVAKPEVFFEATWLLALGVGAIGLARRRPSTRALVALYAVMAGAWLLLTRSHPAYPGFSEPVETSLDEGWERRVFGR